MGRGIPALNSTQENNSNLSKKKKKKKKERGKGEHSTAFWAGGKQACNSEKSPKVFNDSWELWHTRRSKKRTHGRRAEERVDCGWRGGELGTVTKVGEGWFIT